MQEPKDSETHHVSQAWFVGADGTKTDEHIERVHRSRHCNNCHAYGPSDEDWVRQGGIEEFGSCMNLCSAADDADPTARHCSMHQTPIEFRRNLLRPESPALDLVTADKDAIA